MIITLPLSGNISRRPRSEKILQSTEDQNYKRGILFPISYFEKKEREISHLHRPLRVPAEGQPTQHNTTLQNSRSHSAVAIKGYSGNSYPFPNLRIKHSRSTSVNRPSDDNSSSAAFSVWVVKASVGLQREIETFLVSNKRQLKVV